MRKIWTMLLAAILVVPMLLQNTAEAATPISVYIDGNKLATDQAPVSVKGRVLLPLRAIFEALDATVDWNQWTQTVTATKNNTTVVLKLKSKTATINNETVSLDVPAQAIKGRTMVPVRFVSEALGEAVNWNSRTKMVSIVTGSSTEQPGTLYPVSYVTLRDVGNAGDGRDLEVSFSRSSNESLVDHYRILIVKAANASNFNLASALRVTSSNYSTVRPNGSDPAITMSSGTRDVDGALIQSNQSYVGYVLAVGRNNAGNALSNASSKLTLDTGVSVAAATNVRSNDISDYTDGRDLSVSFTRASAESDISGYRVFIVKTKDAGSFNLAAANTNQYYTTVNKSTGSNTTLTGTLSSSSRDTSGDLIKNNVSYTAFVLSVSNTSASNKLSSASSAITLGVGTVAAPIITQVEDRNDNGDGRDLRVSFTKISDESKISGYRIFVVKANDYSNFTLARANAVSNSNYTEFNKTGYNQNQTLSSTSRDVDGALIRNGVSYRVFVMSIGNGSNTGNNALSSASSAITLLNNYSVGSISNLYISDVNDYNDGRDLLVSFDRASDESNISYYRILVVKASKSGSFTLAKANDVDSRNYTQVNTGGNFSKVLSSSTRDVDGDLIRNGVSYRVFVLSVGRGSYAGDNTLSRESSQIALGNNYGVGATSTPVLNDISDSGDGRDLQVTFNRASDESNINHYRVIVAKATTTLDLAKASASGYFTTVYKAGNTLTQTLGANARDIDGHLIQNGTKYRVYVLSVANNNYSGNYALSSAAEITLSDGSTVQAVSGLSLVINGNTGTASDIKVSFKKPANESNILEYRILVVPASDAANFTLADANSAQSFTTVASGGDHANNVPVQDTKDYFGRTVTADTPYRLIVLSVARSGQGAMAMSNQFKINPAPQAPVAAATVANATATAVSNTEIRVNFNEPADTANVATSYALIVVKEGTIMDLSAAVNAYSNRNFVKVDKGQGNGIISVDTLGNPLSTADSAYDLYILSIPTDTSNPNLYGLSGKFTAAVNPAVTNGI
ncbi:copper amine oxidase-like protein [Fontibacillus phaseoli]|uniref:Copper amine oxidase-like protein n=1 Tax=Fontibacillus phaseoli TaxID=1416533 RepID=A0A369B9M4_9BACL|nr:copper amine oxidase N-terminal domain-containing protein [Fontibacillus phaseoli]RCX18222.1 copper amine oxidase-like protein [Fontibacillus phaseoli]